MTKSLKPFWKKETKTTEKKKPLISVIMPIYNVEKYLERSVNSIRNQTYKNLEIILVDDGSTDASSKMCDDFATIDSRILVIHKPNGGSSSARNAGIVMAKGDYIGFCDSDDYIEPDMYEGLLKIFMRHDDAKMAQIMTNILTDEGELVQGPYKNSGEVSYLLRDEMFRLLMLHVGDSSYCTKLIKASFMKQFRFLEGKLNEDFELLLRMLMETDGIYQLERPGYNIVLRNMSNTRGVFRPIMYNAMIENSNTAYAMMEKSFPMYYLQAKRFWLYQRLDYMLHIPVSMMNKDNEVCRGIIVDLKRNRKEIRTNPHLAKKEKRNLLILSYAPKLSKRVHNVIMRLKGVF